MSSYWTPVCQWCTAMAWLASLTNRPHSLTCSLVATTLDKCAKSVRAPRAIYPCVLRFAVLRPFKLCQYSLGLSGPSPSRKLAWLTDPVSLSLDRVEVIALCWPFSIRVSEASACH